MNQYVFSDFKIGMEESFETVITETMMEKFCLVSGDVNPLHRDKDFAVERGFKDRVVYGMLTASLFSTLAGVYLPGKNSLIFSIESKFLLPVYIGDRLKVSGTVKALHECVHQAEISVVIRNQDDKKVVRGKLCVGFLER